MPERKAGWRRTQGKTPGQFIASCCNEVLTFIILRLHLASLFRNQGFTCDDICATMMKVVPFKRSNPATRASTSIIQQETATCCFRLTSEDPTWVCLLSR